MFCIRRAVSWQGDCLTIAVNAGPDSAALVTTPAAGKFYRSDGKLARQQVILTVEAGASLEWLPQETIIYEGARVEADVRLELANGRVLYRLGNPRTGTACGE